MSNYAHRKPDPNCTDCGGDGVAVTHEGGFRLWSDGVTSYHGPTLRQNCICTDVKPSTATELEYAARREIDQ